MQCPDFALSSPSTSSLALKRETLSQAAQQMLETLEKKYITPQRKKGFLCGADCCDRSSNTQALQQCVAKCELPAQQTAKMVDASLKDFQARLQRCVVRCQDQAQDSLRPNPSEAEVQKAQASLHSCGLGCLKEYEKKLPQLHKDLEQQLRQATR